MMSVPEPFRIPGYDFAAPTESDAVASLTRVFGAERASGFWQRACVSARVRPGVVTFEEMGRVAEALAAENAACAAVGRSLQIRLRTHTRLAAKRAALRAGGTT